MNAWSKKTLRLIRDGAYLDRLMEIYPCEPRPRGDISSGLLDRIKTAFETGDDLSLLQTLLSMEKFPYKDSYVGFLRRCRGAIRRNPRTVSRICQTLRGMGLEGILSGISVPKEANTGRGNQFQAWAKRIFRSVPVDQFQESTSGIVMLDASDKEAKDVVNRVMGVGIDKRPDLVAKAGRRYVVGEAKFSTTSGGNQGRAFDDGMRLANKPSGTAFKVFILDGALWVETGSKEYKQIEYGDAPVFSALLLEDYLRSISRK